ncbi:hypothetical protein PHYC_00633 [Phycisphaerales bacterium]|nr:hypothetical protein PHYC_00633 [Phycisphaerales bacterium]
MNARFARSMFAVSGCLSLALAAAAPGQMITGNLGCLTVWNNTGQTVNDFHMEFLNRSPGLVWGVVQGQYNGTWSPNGSGTGFTVDYSGSSTPPGGSAGFGVLLYTSPPHDPNTSASCYWTFNGTQVGARMPVPGYRWVPTTSGGGGGGPWTGLQQAFSNQFSQVFLVQRRVNATPGVIGADDLLVDTFLYDSATILDESPVALGPGQSLSTTIPWGGASNESFVVIYDLFDVSGVRISTLYDAIRVEIAPCDPDVNCDGSLDGFDIEATEQALNGDYSNFCQGSADLNGDGAENGFDIETEEQRVNGAPC